MNSAVFESAGLLNGCPWPVPTCEPHVLALCSSGRPVTGKFWPSLPPAASQVPVVGEILVLGVALVPVSGRSEARRPENLRVNLL
eukprot:s2539_g10.t1